MIVAIEETRIISLMYRQERTDADYGSCIWARFYFDLNNYTLSIESDCGNYVYGWVPTPETESFLHLCSRFDEGYLLEKISNRTVVSGEETWAALKGLLEECNGTDNTEDRHIDMETIESSCYHNRNEDEAFQSIWGAIEETFFKSEIEDYEVWQSIEMDYPASAKKIVSVFHDHIRPVLKKIDKEMGE